MTLLGLPLWGCQRWPTTARNGIFRWRSQHCARAKAARRSRPGHALGRGAAADTALAALFAKHGKDAPYDVAYVCAFRGERDLAFDWLEKAAAAHDPSLALILVENLFANLRSDPRWLPFLSKLGKASEQLAKIPFRVTLPASTLAP
jgi:hypothetical protein